MPQLYLVSGDAIFEIYGWLRPVHLQHGRYTYHLEDREAAIVSLFRKGICTTCKSGRGGRSDVPLFVDDADSGSNGGWIRGPFSQSIRVFSDAFLSLLRPDELSRFDFRSVQLPKRFRRKKYFEMDAKAVVPFVGVTGLDTTGIECSECGTICCYSVDKPVLQMGGVYIDSFICRVDIPDPVPSCFPVGIGGKTQMCMTRKRWDEIRSHKYAKGIASKELGVVVENLCERRPRFRPQFDRCEQCRQWFKPCNVKGRARVVFDYPPTSNEDIWSDGCLEWLKKAVQSQVVAVVRESTPLERLCEMVQAGVKVKQAEVVSFRCAHCWRLGRLILFPKKLHFNWY